MACPTGLPNKADLEKVKRQADFFVTVTTSQNSAGQSVNSIVNPDTGVLTPTVETLLDAISGSGRVILPPIEYGTGTLVAVGPDPLSGTYAINQGIWYAGSTLMFAGPISDLPYDLTQPFDSEKWVAASVSVISNTQTFNVVDGQTDITPLDPLGNPYRIFTAELVINGKLQLSEGLDRTFDIINGDTVALRSPLTYTARDAVQITINAEATQSATPPTNEFQIAQIGGSFRTPWLGELTPGLNIDDLQAAYYEENKLTYNLAGEKGFITEIPPTFLTDGRLKINAITTQLRRRDPQVDSEVFIESFAFGNDIDDPNMDWGPIFRWTFKHLSSRGKRVLLKLGREKYLIKTPQPDGDIPVGNPAFGKNVALWCERADLIAIQGNSSFIMLDGDSPAVAGLDDMIAVSRGDFDEQAFVNWQDFTIHGGIWADINDEPEYNLRMDYNVVKYSYFKRLNTRNARVTNWRICGFVNTVLHCDARFASEYANMFVYGASGLGNTSARTGWTIENCTFDYAGLYGLTIAGGNGHTYLSLINNTADHIGRNRSNQTIVANIPTAAGYFLSGCFDVTWLSNGCELSTRILRVSSSRIIDVRGLYSFGLGSTDAGNPVNEAIIVDGSSSTIKLFGYRAASPINLTHKLRYETPAFANSLSIEHDDTITLADIDPNSGVSGNQTSSASALLNIHDMYKQGYRKLGRDMIIGDPVTNNPTFSHTNLNASNYYKFSRGTGAAVVFTLLELDNAAAGGNLSVFVEVKAGASLGGVPKIPAKYEATTAVDSNTFTTPALAKTSAGADTYNLSLAWAGSKLQLTTSENFASFSVKVEVVGRPSAGTMSFKWVGAVV